MKVWSIIDYVFQEGSTLSVDFICGNDYKINVSLKWGFWKMLFPRNYGSESSELQLELHMEALIHISICKHL